jgi:DNA-directed RNA polymerase subunit M/transcription elongation factor TFIIS
MLNANYIKDNQMKCPICGSYEVSFEFPDISDDEEQAIYLNTECEECKHLFQIGFKIVSVEILGNDESFKL